MNIYDLRSFEGEAREAFVYCSTTMDDGEHGGYVYDVASFSNNRPEYLFYCVGEDDKDMALTIREILELIDDGDILPLYEPVVKTDPMFRDVKYWAYDRYVEHDGDIWFQLNDYEVNGDLYRMSSGSHFYDFPLEAGSLLEIGAAK